MPPCHLRLARLRPVQLRLLSPPITALSSCSLPRIRSRTRAQSTSLQPPGSVCKHRRFALLKRSYKANQPERNSRLLVVRLILTLVRFASLSVRTDLWGSLVASLLVEKTQRTLLDIKLTSKWFSLPRTTLYGLGSARRRGGEDHERTQLQAKEKEMFYHSKTKILLYASC